MASPTISTAAPLHTAVGGGEQSLLLLGVIVLAGLGTGTLFVISLIAYIQRRSTRYLLVTIAVGALFARSVVGFGTVYGLVPMTAHHIIEHSLDFLIAGVILYAALRSKPDHLPDTTVEQT